MTWANVYLVCFLVGFVLSVLSVLTGSSHVHMPHLDLHHGVPHVHVGHAHGGGHSAVSFINFGTIAAFLAWFGGTGYVLTEYSALWFVTALAVSVYPNSSPSHWARSYAARSAGLQRIEGAPQSIIEFPSRECFALSPRGLPTRAPSR